MASAPAHKPVLIEATDLFEAHLTVTDLKRAIQFYGDILGLQLAHVVRERDVAFFWIGSPGKAMLGLWGAGSAPQKTTLHIAFRVSLASVLRAPAALNEAGITPLDFDGRPTDEPVVYAWMPAAAVFFRDPDDHLLEYISMLPDEPAPERGVLPWSRWESVRSSGRTV